MEEPPHSKKPAGKKQKQKQQQTRNQDADGDDAPEKIENITREMMEETSYVIADGLRRVVPYPYTFHAFAKGRWFGKPLIEVLTSDFKTYSREYNERAILSGRVRINGKRVSPQTIVAQHDEITHTVHRHEPPVIGQSVKIVFQSDEVVAIDKPPSIPVHPTGRYRHNTIVMILRKEHGLLDIHPVHRLDRLTSGLLLFARTAAAAERISSMIRGHQVQKTYLARVEGVFPHDHIEVDQPIRVVNFHLGVCEVSPQGKPSVTVFKRVSTNGKSSLVICLPKTGRTHQIRVHLSYLGFPIMHDPIYGSNPRPLTTPLAAPEPSATAAVASITEGLLDELMLEVTNEVLNNAKDDVTLAAPPAAAGATEALAHPPPIPAAAAMPPAKRSRKEEEDEEKEDPLTYCPDCSTPLPDPTPDDLSLFLHALSYEGEGWKYQTEKPSWAADDYLL